MRNGSNSFFVRLLLTALAVLVTAYLLPGVHVENFFWALLVAGVLALFNVTLKPLMILITIPVTVITLGLFLLVINAIVILLASAIIPGFGVDGFWWALGFSLVLSLLNTIFNNLAGSN
jgi:putative membrane protein